MKSGSNRNKQMRNHDLIDSVNDIISVFVDIERHIPLHLDLCTNYVLLPFLVPHSKLVFSFHCFFVICSVVLLFVEYSI